MTDAPTTSKNRNPRATVDSPTKRAAEKQADVFDWLLHYHYSTIPLLMQRLGLKSRHNVQYFKKLIGRDLLRTVEVPFMKDDLVMLTRVALQLADDPDFVAGLYNPDPSKINLTTVPHDLSVQKAVLNRLPDLVSHVPERLLVRAGESRIKIPDAVVSEDGAHLVAIEVELTAKTDKRMFMALTDHLRAMRDARYHSVNYVFSKPSLLGYYKERFDRPEWPVYRYNVQKRRWTETNKNFTPSDELRQSFSFTHEDLL